tara:strand:+ start:1169 stop:2485 length:1317 start_codon:yes stop_codon:yes gene_type:complete
MLLALLSLAFYYSFAYHLVREDFIKLLTLFIALFILCFKLIQFEKWNNKFILGVGILFRLVFLMAEPNLSQDYFRFIWDGQLVGHLQNPYLELPKNLIARPDLVIMHAQELFDGMGSLSARHFSNYPPLNQVIFALAGYMGGKSILGAVVSMRIIIIAADIGVLYYGRKLLRNLNRSPHLIFWYFLNPLVIIELTGNLHFEGVMLFFFVWALYLLSVSKWQWAGIVFALSISIKLVPLLFLPLFLKYLGLRKSIMFYLIVGVTSAVLWYPFYTPEFIDNYTTTIGLWFSNFEFNAGLYNAVKSIAKQFGAKPWELIKTYGSLTPYITIGAVLLFTFIPKNQKLGTLITSMLWVLTLYYFLSATVHPWYIIFLVLLVVFTEYRFAVIWSAAVVLSYAAYANTPFKEDLGLIAIEYISVYGFMFYEIFKLRGKYLLFHKN